MRREAMAAGTEKPRTMSRLVVSVYHRERDIGQGGGGLVDGKSVNAGDLAVVRHRHEGEAVMGVARDRHRPDGVVVDGLRQGRAAAALAEHGL